MFKTVALAWHKSNKKWSQNTADRQLASLNNHVFPVIGSLPVSELKPRHFIVLLKGIEGKDLLEVASRTRQHLRNIMRDAVHQGSVESNPTDNLEGVTTPPVRRHYPACRWNGFLSCSNALKGIIRAANLAVMHFVAQG